MQPKYIALPTPPLTPATLARRAAEYARITAEPPSDWREEQLAAIVMDVPPAQRGSFHALVAEARRGR